MNVTSADVAKLAGVSQSTVSRVFVDGSSVSAKSRQKVLEAAKALNYRPNAFARSLTTQESKLVGLVFPDVDYPVHMGTLQLLSRALMQHGYSAVLIPWSTDEQDVHSVSNIFQYRVDGVIAASAQLHSALYDECRETNTPIVQFARLQEGSNTSAAISDNYGAGRQAAEALVKRGARRLAYLTGDIPTPTNTDRWQGFANMTQSLLGRQPHYASASYSYDTALQAIRQLLATDERPDAVFCATDILAVALMDVARLEFDLAIPEQLQVIGFDNIPQASFLNYQLSTFRQDYPRLAKESARLLTEQIQSKEKRDVMLLVPAELTLRSTTLEVQ